MDDETFAGIVMCGILALAVVVLMIAYFNGVR